MKWINTMGNLLDKLLFDCSVPINLYNLLLHNLENLWYNAAKLVAQVNRTTVMSKFVKIEEPSSIPHFILLYSFVHWWLSQLQEEEQSFYSNKLGISTSVQVL